MRVRGGGQGGIFRFERATPSGLRFFDEYTAVGIVALEWRRPLPGMTPLPLSLIADLEPINGELA